MNKTGVKGREERRRGRAGGSVSGELNQFCEAPSSSLMRPDGEGQGPAGGRSSTQASRAVKRLLPFTARPCVALCPAGLSLCVCPPSHWFAPRSWELRKSSQAEVFLSSTRRRVLPLRASSLSLFCPSLSKQASV